MSSKDGWVDVTSRNQKKKKSKLHRGLLPSKKKKNASKSPQKLGSKNASNFDPQYQQQPPYQHQHAQQQQYFSPPRLSPKQERVLHQILRQWPQYKIERVLPKVITDLDLSYFDPRNESQKVRILNSVVTELQDSMSAHGKPLNSLTTSNSKAKPKKLANDEHKNNFSLSPIPKNNKKLSKKKPVPKSNTRNNLNPQQQQQQSLTHRRDRGDRAPKFGKFSQILRRNGSLFLSFVDNATLLTMIRMPIFESLLLSKLLPEQRFFVYTSPKDMQFRLNAFNNELRVESQLKFYELRTRTLDVKCIECIFAMIANALSLDPRFVAKYENANYVSMDVTNSFDIAQEIVHQKCKQTNIWRAWNAMDLNGAYLVEFVDYQNRIAGLKYEQNGNRNGNGNMDEDGNQYLNAFDRYILEQRLISNENIRSIHYAYLKIADSHFEPQCFVLMFVELKSTKARVASKNKRHLDAKPFVLWYGKCGGKVGSNGNGNGKRRNIDSYYLK